MPRQVRTRRLLIATAAMATVLAMVVPAWASFPDQGNRIVFARSKSMSRVPAPPRGVGGFDLFTMKPNGDDASRVVRSDALMEYGGHVAPDGSRLVFTGIKGKGQADIFTTDADGSHRQKLTTSGNNFSPNWSRNGQQIVWARSAPLRMVPFGNVGARRGGGGGLMLMNADGTDKHSIAPGLVFSPGWSPSAGRIAYSTVDGDSLDIWTIKPDGSDPAQLTDYGVGSYAIFGDWAPDGDSFAFTWSAAARGEGAFSLWVAPRTNPTDTLLIASDVDELFAPVFTADGSRVIFVRQDGSDYELYSVKVNGTGERQLTTNNAADILTVVPLF